MLDLYPPVEYNELIFGEHKPINGNGKHTALGVQHEFITHTDALDGHPPLTLLHGTRAEHRVPGAQKLVLLIV